MFTFKALGARQILTCNPTNIQAIAATKFDSFGVESMRANLAK
jgi:hypothetical protein